MTKKEHKLHIILLILSGGVFIWSFIGLYDLFAWTMLTIPILLLILYAVVTYRRFQFTSIAYIMLFFYIIILWIGAKYTYTLNPWFDIIQEMFNHSRNHYDRVGHFAQGFVPVFFVKEYLLRKRHFKRTFFFYLVVFMMILAIAAAWELLEFAATIISNRPADYMLAAQGDIWDTQWDMTYALIGAAVSLLTFGKMHDRQIAKKMELDALKRESSSID
jgi:putative membrane protein